MSNKNNSYQNNVNPDVINDEMIVDKYTEFEEVENINGVTKIESKVITEEIHVDNSVDIGIDSKEDTTNSENTEEIIPDIIEEKTINVKSKPVVNFYKVGTGFIRNKCINQITTTLDLETAKDECIKARDKYMKTYHVFDNTGNAIYTVEYNIPKDNYYRVGTDWKKGRCMDQKYYTVSLDEACKKSDENTKLTGVIHNVYDPTGKIVFSSKKKLTLLSNKKRKVIEHADWYIK